MENIEVVKIYFKEFQTLIMTAEDFEADGGLAGVLETHGLEKEDVEKIDFTIMSLSEYNQIEDNWKPY